MQDKTSIQDQIKQLPGEIQNLALSLLGFTEGLKACFTAADACGEPLFKDLRSLLVGDAKIYFHAVCPLTKEVMYDIHKFFNVLGVLDSVEKFKKSFNYIITETAKIIEKLTLCEQLHLETLTTANHRDIVAQKLAKTLGLREKIENEKAEAAEKQRKAAEENAKNAKAPWWMWAIPGAGVIIGTVVTKSIRADYEKLADSELQKTMAAKERGSVAAMAANLISNTVVPALRDYIENIQGVIKILTKIQIEVKEVNDNTKDAQSMGDNDDMVEIFLDAVNKNIASIKQTTSDMIAYYKICEAAVTAFDSLQDAKDYVYDALEKVTEVKAEPESLWSRMKKVLTSKKGIMTQIEGILTKDGKF